MAIQIKESPSYNKTKVEPNVFEEIEGKQTYNKVTLTNAAIKKAERLGKQDREKNSLTRQAIKTQAKRAERIAQSQLKKIAKGTKGKIATGLKQSQNKSLGYPRNYEPQQNVYINDSNIPYHVDMKAPRDNGFRPHEPRSLVKEPDIEGYQRNLLLQPAKNIWEEPRKHNVWDETFNPQKKKSIFEK